MIISFASKFDWFHGFQSTQVNKKILSHFMSPMYSTVKETLFNIFRLKVLITSITYVTLNGKNTDIYEFLITRKLSILANCSLWSNETMFFKWKLISNDIGKFLYSFNHLLHSDLSTIYFPSSLNKLKLFPFPFDFSNKPRDEKKKRCKKSYLAFHNRITYL